MKHIKLNSILFGFAFISLALTGCGGNGGSTSSISGSSSSGSSSSSSSSSKPSKGTITYVNWNLSTETENNLERRMIAAFEESSGYKVNIVENINTSAYEDAIIAMATKNQMPDVFMLTNMSFGLENRYLMDISSLAAKDTEWNDIPSPVEKATHIFGGIYAIPFAIHMMGYFENLDLMDDYNLKSLKVSPTYNDFYSTVQALKKPSEKVMGLNLENGIYEWFPSVTDTSYQYFTYSGEGANGGYHLDSDAFADAINKTASFRTNKLTFDSLSAEEREALGYTDSTLYWNDGKLGLRYGYTYEIPDIVKNGKFNMRFIGTPGGRTPIVGDYLGISPTCKNPEAAYEFAKWMSFGHDGIKKRLELDTKGTEFSSLPLSTDSSIINAYFDENRMEGLEDCFQNIDNGVVEGVKVILGYVQSRWNVRVGKNVTITVNGENVTNPQMGQVIDQAWLGNITWADYASGLNTVATSAYQKAYNNIKGIYDPSGN